VRWPFRKKEEPVVAPEPYKHHPMLIVIAINHDEAEFYIREHHMEWPRRNIAIITGDWRGSRGRKFTKDDVIMAVGRYHEMRNLQQVLDVLKTCYLPGQWPKEELWLR
jgi:hypothetical protein